MVSHKSADKQKKNWSNIRSADAITAIL